MDPLTIIAILEAVIKLGSEIPELVTLVSQAIDLVKSGQPPTPEQQAQIDAALQAAHDKLQSA